MCVCLCLKFPSYIYLKNAAANAGVPPLFRMILFFLYADLVAWQLLLLLYYWFDLINVDYQ
tara:strand:+ start:1070 stop:1252 length:183 start_codon:yes stop_codon:yes gene_type:complete